MPRNSILICLALLVLSGCASTSSLPKGNLGRTLRKSKSITIEFQSDTIVRVIYDQPGVKVVGQNVDFEEVVAERIPISQLQNTLVKCLNDRSIHAGDCDLVLAIPKNMSWGKVIPVLEIISIVFSEVRFRRPDS